MLYRRLLTSFLALTSCGYSSETPEQEKSSLSMTLLNTVRSEEQDLYLKAQNAIQNYIEPAATNPYTVDPEDSKCLQEYEIKKEEIFKVLQDSLSYFEKDPRGQLKTFTRDKLMASGITILGSEYPLEIRKYITDVIENSLSYLKLMNRPVDKFYEKELFFIDVLRVYLEGLKGLINVRYDWLESNVWLDEVLEKQKQREEKASHFKQTQGQQALQNAYRKKLEKKNNQKISKEKVQQIESENPEKEIALLKFEKANLFLEIDDLKEKLKKQEEVIKLSNQNVKNLENRNKKLQVQLNKPKVETQKPQINQPGPRDDSKIKDLQSRLDQLTTENAELKKSKSVPNNDSENRARQLQSQVDKLKAENEQLKKANSDARSASNTHESDIIALKKKNAQLIKSLQESAKREEQLKTRNQELSTNFVKKDGSAASAKKPTALPAKTQPAPKPEWPVLPVAAQVNLASKGQNSVRAEQPPSKPISYANAVTQTVDRKTLTFLGSEMTKTKDLFSQEKIPNSTSQNDAEQRIQILEKQFNKMEKIVESLTKFKEFEIKKENEKDRKVTSILKKGDPT